ncbi:cytochrome P450 [Lederbergia wuyishanensis]|uniref:Fatty-acid peroxygenase n=1 Tax=Lederbergia wuyishanensis TaxID=1347903 RepID=A0ABU0D641_9BACI|nr:cytochrome P450 [Lederbergia wuyishanensis]MCJ8008715.1 cytochrome P450 [Lederbergia wuyishanensis]MDQ0343865.1 fatty-acid peroxygenase [Lederbergia wuyishanensis]
MSNVNPMPKEEGLDHTLSFAREGYMYIPNRRHSFNSNIFETRLLGKKAICMGGKEAAELFYDNEKFMRQGAAPNRVLQTLFGAKGVQTLDGTEHKHRKEMFMSLMSHERIEQLIILLRKEWESTVTRWEGMNEVVLYEEVKEILCRVACEWAGVPIQEDEIKSRSKEFGSLFESVAAIGPNHWLGRTARNNIEKWIIGLVEEVRNQELESTENTALHQFSWHRDLEGNLLDAEVAAVEVVNIIRPIIAISIFINFTALAIHQFPEAKAKLQSSGEKYTEMFIQEVRRFYPFFPLVAARVKKDFIWNGYTFDAGTLTLLDLYGTNHDPTIWDNPGLFNPDRFSEWEGSPFSFIPQGGGDYLTGHRCAGEWITVEVMKAVVDQLINRMEYNVPEQDLSFSLVSMPSMPASKFVINHVKST